MISGLLQIERHLPKRKDHQNPSKTYISNQVKDANINTSATCSYRSKFPISKRCFVHPPHTWHKGNTQDRQGRAGRGWFRFDFESWVLESQQEWVNQGQKQFNGYKVLLHKYLLNLTWRVEKFRTFYSILPLFGGNLLVAGAISLSVWTRMMFFLKIVAVQTRIPTTPWFAESFMILPPLPVSKRPGGCPWPNRHSTGRCLEKAAPSGDALQECFRWRKKLHHTQRCGATNHANQQRGKGDPMKMSMEGYICCVEQRITNNPKRLSLLLLLP